MTSTHFSFSFAFAFALLAVEGAHAQLVHPEKSTLEAQPTPEAKAFAKLPLLVEPAYMRNQADRPESNLKDGYRSDPRLVAGFNLNRNVALEVGYLERKDRGYHKIDEGRPEDKSGALGIVGFHTYAGTKLTLPISENLSAYGTAGVSYSERRGGDSIGKRELDTDVGAYTKLGAEYRVNKRTTVTAESQNFGKTAEKWGNGTNANGVNAKLKMGF